jgi:antitoxin (DNA-binding transcriptional repressor) of toxin-antitoxin stability system
MNVSEAAKDFVNLVDRVYSDGITVELERDDKIIARLTPVEPQSILKVSDLNSFLQALPSLGDDANAFADDVRSIRSQFPAESSPWD